MALERVVCIAITVPPVEFIDVYGAKGVINGTYEPVVREWGFMNEADVGAAVVAGSIATYIDNTIPQCQTAAGGERVSIIGAAELP